MLSKPPKLILITAATIAIRYTTVRRQGAKGLDGLERQVITYPSVYYRLLPILAHAYVFVILGRNLVRRALSSPRFHVSSVHSLTNRYLLTNVDDGLQRDDEPPHFGRHLAARGDARDDEWAESPRQYDRDSGHRDCAPVDGRARVQRLCRRWSFVCGLSACCDVSLYPSSGGVL